MAEQQIVVENRGIGYEILVPASVIQKLPRIGNEVKVYTYMHVREDAMQLYGFTTKDEREMFQLLITVNGIGPKGALGILSIMDTDALRFAILSDDAKSISKAPGIGAKTASKLILELKDKVDFEEAVDTMLTQGEQMAAEAAAGDVGYRANDAIQALVALGYSSTEAVKAVKKVTLTDEMTTEDILKASLKYL
ncbi:MAG TPA: Holliday junction branch migration protein RuvA [Lachnospiraceae bacterium]|nr:Holliday junction branch migration protein RuvA [Lachnospiraceae bacterium]